MFSHLGCGVLKLGPHNPRDEVHSSMTFIFVLAVAFRVSHVISEPDGQGGKVFKASDILGSWSVPSVELIGYSKFDY